MIALLALALNVAGDPAQLQLFGVRGHRRLGAGARRIFDGKALTFPSGEQLFVAAGDGAAAARLFRFAQ